MLNLKKFIKARKKFIKKKIHYIGITANDGSNVHFVNGGITHVNSYIKKDATKLTVSLFNAFNLCDPYVSAWNMLRAYMKEEMRTNFDFVIVFQDGEYSHAVRNIFQKDKIEQKRINEKIIDENWGE